jgi:anti-sigma factor RsiW
MSRDPRDRKGANDPERSARLLAAYVDGVAELLPDERHDVEALLARDPGAEADAEAAHALLDRLRALPPEGGEPDWAAMERSIRHAVAAAPRPWWRRWQWLVPALTCATAAAVLLVIWPRTDPLSSSQPRPPSAGSPEHTEPLASKPPAGDSVVALWLDGSEVDVDVSAPDGLAGVGIDLGDAPAGQPVPPPIDDADEVGLLPATDLAWIDTLDDATLDRVERWLAAPQDPASSDHRHDSPGPRGNREGTQETQERKI